MAITVDGTVISVTAGPLNNNERQAIANASAPSSTNPFLTASVGIAASGSNPTTLAANGTGGSSTITLTDTTGYIDGVYIDVLLDDGTLHTTTQNGAPSGSVVTLDDALPSSGTVATSGNYVSIPDLETVLARGGRDYVSKRLDQIEGVPGATARLAASLSASATSGTLHVALSTRITRHWIAIDPYTSECEIRLATVSGTSISWTGGLAYSHVADDPILLLGPTLAAVNVDMFGAKGDGANAAADTTGIARAVVQAKSLGLGIEFRSAGDYDTTASIFLGKSAGGDGDYVRAVYGNGATVTGTCTGDPVFDWIGANADGDHLGKVMKDITIVGDSSNEPSCGLLLARVSTSEGAGIGRFFNVTFNGNFSETCVYNYASEENRWFGCDFKNKAGNSCYVGTGTNELHSMASPNATIDTGVQSNTTNWFFGCRFTYQRAASVTTSIACAVDLLSCNDVGFVGCFFDVSASQTPSSTVQVRIRKESAGAVSENISFTGACLFHGTHKSSIWIGAGIQSNITLQGSRFGSATNAVEGEASAGVTRSRFDCGNKPFNFSASSCSVSDHTTIRTSSTVNIASTANSFEIVAPSGNVTLSGGTLLGLVIHEDIGERRAYGPRTPHPLSKSGSDATPDVSNVNVFTSGGSATALDGLDWGGSTPPTGHRVTLLLTGSRTVTHNAAVTYPILLRSAGNHSGVANEALEFIFDGTYWVQPE